MSEEQEDLKSLLVPFSYPISIGESDKTTVRNLRVSLGKMSIKEDKGLYSVTQNVSMNFLMKIPKEILDYLEGYQYHESGYTDGIITYGVNNPKSISSASIEGLSKSWNIIISHYRDKYAFEKCEMRKVIMFSMNTTMDRKKSRWNRFDQGEAWNIGIQYVVCMLSKDGRLAQKDGIYSNISRDPEFFKFKEIDWTEEREEFFKGLGSNFVKIIQMMSEFTKGMTNDNIDKLISSGQKLIG